MTDFTSFLLFFSTHKDGGEKGSTHKDGGEKCRPKLLRHGELLKASRGKMSPCGFKDKFEKMGALEETMVMKYI